MSDAPTRREFVMHPIVLRNGERVNPAEFEVDALEPMHDALDAIQKEQDVEAVTPAPVDDEPREARW